MSCTKCLMTVACVDLCAIVWRMPLIPVGESDLAWGWSFNIYRYQMRSPAPPFGKLTMQLVSVKAKKMPGRPEMAKRSSRWNCSADTVLTVSPDIFADNAAVFVAGISL